MATTLPRVGDQIRAFRERLGLRQEQMANILGVSLNTYKSWEGRIEPPPHRLRHMIHVTGVNGEWLLGVPGAEMWGTSVRAAMRQLKARLAGQSEGGTIADRTRDVLQWLLTQPWCRREVLAGILKVELHELTALLEGRPRSVAEYGAVIGPLSEWTGINPAWWVTGDPADLAADADLLQRWGHVIARFEILGISPEAVAGLVGALTGKT